MQVVLFFYLEAGAYCTYVAVLRMAYLILDLIIHGCTG
jgi:hypothetical protein